MNKLLIIVILVFMGCNKPPKEGCADKRADNYNLNSENNCCCKFQCTVWFKGLVGYEFYINGTKSDTIQNIAMSYAEKPILWRADSAGTEVANGNFNLQSKKVNYIYARP